MKNNRTFLIILVLTIFTTIVVFFVTNQKHLPLISPISSKDSLQQTSPFPSSRLNPPKEIKYDSNTDLQKELDSVNPEVLDEDFET